MRPVWIVNNGPIMRYFVRLCIQFPGFPAGHYVPVTFLVDSSAIDDMHWSAKAQEMLAPYFRFDFVQRDARKCGVYGAQTPPMVMQMRSGDKQFPVHFRQTPSSMEPLNIIGLRFLKKFAMALRQHSDGSASFVLENLQSSVLEVSAFNDLNIMSE